jgi:hypothetical protein
VVFAFACSDIAGPPAVLPELLPSGGRASGQILATFECAGRARAAEIACTPVADPQGGPRRALLGQNQVKLRSNNISYDSISGIFAFDVTVQNLLAVAIGTPDGTTVEGEKVFYESGPTATSYIVPGDMGTAGVANADGRLDFTRADQPYHFYNTILQPQATSAAERWELYIPKRIATFAFVVRVFTSTPTENRVPAQAPDTVPIGLYDNPANMLANSPHFALSDKVLRDIVSLRFHPGATREERQAAVDVVHGAVVGGQPMPGDESYYLVRVDADGTGSLLAQAIDTLNTLPQVAVATPEYRWLPGDLQTHVEPEDDGDWTSPWRTNPALADGDNKAMETIAAPGAWGCVTGNSSTKVGVLDIGFFSNPDLMVNTTFAPAVDAYDLPGYVEADHGTTTAALVAAAGNNGTGITGMMWSADLSLYDVSVGNGGELNSQNVERLFGLITSQTPKPMMKLLEYRLLQAIGRGASIINISLGVPASASNTIPAPQRAAEALRIATGFAAGVKRAPNKPLLVIGAGNDGVNAYWAVLPILAELVPDQAIVVGGITGVSGDGVGTRWIGSNDNEFESGIPYPTLVQIAAPAQEVYTLGKNGVVQHSGTSLAAPLVAGIAGLLKSFDPRLTALDLKNLLISGSVSGGQFVAMGGTVFAANAAKSLALAAQRPGAPFCGGVPIWHDPSGAVMARRIVNGTPAPTAELLFTQAGSELVPMEGETTIRVDGSYWVWSNGAWAPFAGTRTDPYGNATNRSKQGISHDGSRTVRVERVEVSDTQEKYQIWRNDVLLVEVPSTYARKDPVNACVHWTAGFGACTSTITVWTGRITTFPAVAISPDGSEILLTISRQQSTNRTEPPYACGAEYCADHGLEITTLASQLVFIDGETGQERARQTGPIRHVLKAGYSEDATRLVLQEHFTYYYSTWTGTALEQVSTTYCDA